MARTGIPSGTERVHFLRFKNRLKSCKTLKETALSKYLKLLYDEFFRIEEKNCKIFSQITCKQTQVIEHRRKNLSSSFVKVTKSLQNITATERNRQWRLLAISFIEWIFALVIVLFKRGYVIRQSDEAFTDDSAYGMHWIYPKFAILAFISSAAIIYISLSFELRKAILMIFFRKSADPEFSQRQCRMLLDSSGNTGALCHYAHLEPREAIVQ